MAVKTSQVEADQPPRPQWQVPVLTEFAIKDITENFSGDGEDASEQTLS